MVTAPLIALLVLACAQQPPEEVDAVALATRTSLVLRGVRPTPVELAQVEADPDALVDLRAGWLEDPRLGRQVGGLLAEAWRTRSEGYEQDAELFGLDDAVDFHGSVGDELPRFLAQVIDAGLPWTTVLDADWTMADQRLLDLWPLAWVDVDAPDDLAAADGWRRARYTDGRPIAGVLSMTSLYWRYDSTPSNANRRRASHLLRALLCHDLAGQPVTFSLDTPVTDEADLEAAIATEPACISCHAVLDPLAANWFGFFFHSPGNPADANRYHPEREGYWQSYLEVSPGYYGEDVDGLAQVAARLRADPRFPTCLVETLEDGLLEQDASATVNTDDADDAALAAQTEASLVHREAFVTGGGTVQAALASLLEDPRFAQAPRSRLLPPTWRASAVEGLTGYRWTVQDTPVMQSDQRGLRTLAGGFDGMQGTRRAATPGPTVVLVQQRLAEAAAAHAVQHDPAGLFALAGVQAGLDDPQHAAQVEHLMRAVLSRPPKPGEVDGLQALWQDLHDLDDSPEAAWQGLLTALLRHPDFLLY